MNERDEFARQRQAFRAELAADDRLRAAGLDIYAKSDEHGFSYVWDWLGVPIIQTPTDLVVLQEIVWRTRPQLVIESGVARGGSVIFFASLLELIGDGGVIGVDIALREDNRTAIEQHALSTRIQLLDGSSTAPSVVAALHHAAAGVERVMVVLDSDHTGTHVEEELQALADLVSVGCYLVVADTIIEHVEATFPPGRSWGRGNSPATAVERFLEHHTDFVVDESIEAKLLLSSNPGGYLLRVSDEGRD